MSKKILSLFPEILQTLETARALAISEERKNLLIKLTDYLNSELQSGKGILLNFICTHNSRRSHLCQAWAQCLAYHFKIPEMLCYSGGTEDTEVSENAIEALKQNGFKVIALSVKPNKVHAIKYAVNAHPIIAFSKKFNHPFNPKTAYLAIMTCSEADKDCPVVQGAEKRFSLTYSDPKQFDGTIEQTQKYQVINLQIASELYFVFSRLKT